MSGTGRITDVFRQSKSNFQRSTSAKRGAKEQEELPGVSGIDAVSDADVSEEERVLRQFDLDPSFGPCAGMSRLERWSRAEKFGLNPPQQVKQLLQRLEGEQWNKNLWNGRV